MGLSKFFKKEEPNCLEKLVNEFENEEKKIVQGKIILKLLEEVIFISVFLILKPGY